MYGNSLANGTCLLHTQQLEIVALLVCRTGFCRDAVGESVCGILLLPGYYQRHPRSAKQARGVCVDLICRP